MNVISREKLRQLFKYQSFFDYKRFCGLSGEIVLYSNEVGRYIDLDALDKESTNAVKYYKKETLFLRLIDVLFSNIDLIDIYIFPLYDRWIKTSGFELEFMNLKEFLKINGIKNTKYCSISFDSKELVQIKNLLNLFCINSFRSYTDIAIYVRCKKIQFVLCPCDHFDCHIYPSNIDDFNKHLVESMLFKEFQYKVIKT